MDIIILIAGLIVLRLLQSKDKVGYDKITIVVAMYIGYELLSIMFSSGLIYLLLSIGFILIIQKLLFKYRSVRGMLVYTLIYFLIITCTSQVLQDINAYVMNNIFSMSMQIIIGVLLFLLVGYINIKDYEKTKRTYKFYVLGIVLVILLLNSYIYSQFHYKEINSNAQIIQIDSCDKLSSLESNNKYELSQDLDCNGKQISNRNKIIPYVIEINGNGYKVSNASIEGSLINKINGKSSITNIRFEDIDINGEGIVEGNYGSIEQVAVVNSDVISRSRAGGIVGYNAKGGNINNSYSAGNNIIGESKVGGIAGENYGGIGNTYSTSYVEGYEYVGGLVGHQGKPGYTESSFYDNVEDKTCLNKEELCYSVINEDNNISKGALEVLGQDRKTMEVIEGFKEEKVNGGDMNNYYNSLSEEDKQIVNEAYKTDTQDWNTDGVTGRRTVNNVVVLNNNEYIEYINNGGIQKDSRGIIGIGVKLAAKTTVGSIIDELTEGNISFGAINVLPYNHYNGDGSGTGKADAFYSNETLESDYGFSSDVWDYSSLTEESIGTSEPIKLL